jgi:hypothetical protein
MKKKYFQIGSIKAKFRKLAVLLWHNFVRFGKSSLAGIWKAVKQTFRFLRKLNLLKLLKCIELLVNIADKIRHLLFCNQTAHFVQVAC